MYINKLSPEAKTEAGLRGTQADDTESMLFKGFFCKSRYCPFSMNKDCTGQYSTGNKIMGWVLGLLTNILLHWRKGILEKVQNLLYMNKLAGVGQWI